MNLRNVPRSAFTVLVIGALLATPLAGALSAGVGFEGMRDMQDAGATPKYGQVWAGTWLRSSWTPLENNLRTMRDAGITPVILWYYWGDSISVDAVKHGKDGRTKAEWDSMAKSLASRVKAVMGDRTVYIVLEPEFNKNGISNWETFDGYLEAQANFFRTIPNARVVIGFGHWGGWDIFDRAVAASHHTGFQLLRGSTRDSVAITEGAADTVLSVTKQLKGKFGKTVVMYDFGISTYGNWEGVQERALQRVLAKRADFDAAGLKFIIWRYTRDNSLSSGYYGAAEKYWGVLTTSGAKKPAYDELVTLLKGSTSTGGSGAAPPSGSVFTNVKGNEWWIQASVANGPSKVEARVNGGTWKALAKQSWGDWAVSTSAPKGSVVELRATYSDGKTASASYNWPDATPASGGSTGGGTTPWAKFSNPSGNDWWLQIEVSSTKSLSKVDARVNGGSWKPLVKQSWGAWAASYNAPKGSKVEFRAVASDGATLTSSAYTWTP